MRHPCRQILLLLALCAALPVVCIAQQRRAQQHEGHAGAIIAVAFAPDGKTIVSGSYDETLKLWNVRTGNLLRTINVYPNKKFAGGIIGSVAFAPDSRTVVAGSRYAPIQQWEVTTGKWRRLFRGYVCGFRCSDAVFSPDGKTIAGGDGEAGTVKIWDVASGRVLHTFDKPRDEKNPRFPHNAEHILFSPDGSRLYADSGPVGLIQVWDVATGREVQRIKIKDDIGSMALSPDGRLLLVGGSANDGPHTARGLVALLDTETGREVRRFPGQWSNINEVAFAPDGKLVASAGYDVSDGEGFNVVKLWEVATGREVRRMIGHREAIHALTFAPDGLTIVSGGRDATLKLWDVATGKEIRSFPAGPKEPAQAVAAGARP